MQISFWVVSSILYRKLYVLRYDILSPRLVLFHSCIFMAPARTVHFVTQNDLTSWFRIKDLGVKCESAWGPDSRLITSKSTQTWCHQSLYTKGYTEGDLSIFRFTQTAMMMMMMILILLRPPPNLKTRVCYVGKLRTKAVKRKTNIIWLVFYSGKHYIKIGGFHWNKSSMSLTEMSDFIMSKLMQICKISSIKCSRPGLHFEKKKQYLMS